jgi:hypothetical protein
LARWALLQALRNENQKFGLVVLEVDTSAYMTKNVDGLYSLRYCNVFVE